MEISARSSLSARRLGEGWLGELDPGARSIPPRGGRRVGGLVEGRTMQIWDGDEAVEDGPSTTWKEVRKKHANSS
jgi:hypothetical protein